MDYYKILGVEKNASDNTIKQAYKKLAKKHHPDMSGGDEATFKQLNEAYDVLKNPETRKQYDMGNAGSSYYGNGRRPSNDGFEFYTSEGVSAKFNMDDIFRHMDEHLRRGGGGGPGGFNPRSPKKNHDLRITLNLNLEDLVIGDNESTVEKHLSVRMSNGEREIVKINIPPNIHSGQTLKFAGLGDNAHLGLTRGDLFVTIVINNHASYEKHGLDLITQYVISSIDAILGCEVVIKTLTGKNLKLKIPAGTQYGSLLNMRAEGLKHKDMRGNIIVEIHIKTPTNLTPTQIDLIRQAKAEK